MLHASVFFSLFPSFWPALKGGFHIFSFFIGFPTAFVHIHDVSRTQLKYILELHKWYLGYFNKGCFYPSFRSWFSVILKWIVSKGLLWKHQNSRSVLFRVMFSSCFNMKALGCESDWYRWWCVFYHKLANNEIIIWQISIPVRFSPLVHVFVCNKVNVSTFYTSDLQAFTSSSSKYFPLFCCCWCIGNLVIPSLHAWWHFTT